MDPRTTFASAAELTQRLAATGYLADDGWPRPAPGAAAAAGRCSSRASRASARPRWPRRSPRSPDLPLIRLQCYEGIDASQALYDWDFPRQILHLRALEAVAGGREHRRGRRGEPVRRPLPARPPVLQALRESPVVLLIDEIDRADDEFEAFLLEVLATSGHDPRARHRHGDHAARRRAHLQPHPRGARRAQAALPLPLGRPSRLRPRGRDPARARSRGAAALAEQVVRAVQVTAARPRTCSSRRASPRPSTGRGRCTCSAPASSTPRSRRPRSGAV